MKKVSLHVHWQEQAANQQRVECESVSKCERERKIMMMHDEDEAHFSFSANICIADMIYDDFCG